MVHHIIVWFSLYSFGLQINELHGKFEVSKIYRRIKHTKKDTLYSIASVILMAISAIIVISFTGQGH